ncbi:MAG TPA: S-adenosylmethionine:tRNA ribosyltransferase-isomerase [Candidatus Dormibacteraeota bacterium]
MIAPPPQLRAALPAELRGLRRDGAKLCVVDRSRRRITHTTVAHLDDHLEAGDVLVVNSSRTLPGALAVLRANGSTVQLRSAMQRADGWDALAVEVTPPHRNVTLDIAETLIAASGLRLRVISRRAGAPLLWRLNIEAGDGLDALLRDGEPIRYSYVPDHVPLEHYQTVYATVPGSVETPSAGRHLTWELLTRMRAKGVRIADIVLHCTISSMQDDDVDARKPLIEEWFRVDERAAEAVNTARRVIAVGTTVIRALESTVDARGMVQPAEGWTDLVIRPDSRLRAVDGLLTGLHEPPATHLDILRAVVDADLLERAYAEVREREYLWHEFGDAMLIA